MSLFSLLLLLLLLLLFAVVWIIKLGISIESFPDEGLPCSDPRFGGVP